MESVGCFDPSSRLPNHGRHSSTKNTIAIQPDHLIDAPSLSEEPFCRFH